MRHHEELWTSQNGKWKIYRIHQQNARPVTAIFLKHSAGGAFTFERVTPFDTRIPAYVERAFGRHA